MDWYMYSMYNLRKNAKTKNINHEVEKSGYNRGGELEFCNGVIQARLLKVEKSSGRGKCCNTSSLINSRVIVEV